MALFTAIGIVAAKVFASGAFGAFLVKTAAQIANSLLIGLLTKKKSRGSYGVSGNLGVGEEVPRGFPIGASFTEGSPAYANEWGKAGKIPNAYFTQVMALSDLPIKGLRRVSLNGAWVTLGATAYLNYGFPIQECIAGGTQYAWVKFYDGTQTTADPFLTGTVSSADHPYSANRIGYGVAYAIVTVRVNDKLFPGFPTWGFEIESTRLYDISKDSTAGGAGTQRWATPSTWGGDGDDLPVVQAYNVLRGIRYAGAWLYGFQGTLAGQLPSASWVQRIAQCRAAVTVVAATEPRFRAGGYLTVDTEAGSAVEAIMAAAAGSVAEMGGIYKPVVGVLDAPVATITDDDIVSTEESGFFPAPRLDSLINGVMCRYPEPAEVWQAKDAPAIFRSDLEAADAGRRLISQVELSNVPYANQVQRLMGIAIEEARRFRRHVEPLPPKFWRLEPNDIVVRNSDRHGYISKQFIVKSLTMRADAHIMAELQEVDPSDYDFDGWTGYQPVVVTPPAFVQAPSFAVPGFVPTAGVIVDNAGGPRRVSVDIPWDGSEQDGVRAFEWEINLWTGSAVGALVDNGSTTNVAAGLVRRTSGVVPQTAYAVRARFVGDFDGPWTAYQIVITGAAQTTDAQGGELIANGNFGAGTLANWFAEVGAAYQSVQPYTLGTNPFTHILRYQFTANGQVGITRTGADVPGSPRITAIPVQPGEQYRIQGLYAVQSGSVYLDIRHEWVLGNGTVVAGVAGPNRTGGATGAFLPLSYTDTAPAGAVGMYVKTASQCTGATGDVLFANISARAMTGASLVRDNAINRAALTDDSLQDVYRTTDFTRYTPAATSNGFVLATHSVPAQVDGVILKRGVSFEARRPAGFTGNAPPNEVRVELQGRIRVFGGAFSAWRVLSSWTGANLLQFGSGTGPWDANSDTGNLMGPFDEYQYQLIVETDIQVSSANTWIGNVNFTVARTTKGGA